MRQELQRLLADIASEPVFYILTVVILLGAPVLIAWLM